MERFFTIQQDPLDRPAGMFFSIPATQAMTDSTYSLFQAYIERELGVRMAAEQKNLLQARLQKRLHRLGMRDFEAYGSYLFRSPHGEGELENVIDAVTTHKTEFFRHPDHFSFLSRNALPDLLSRRKAGKKLRFWCAGCSTGEEAYTLAMVLAEYAETHQPFRYNIIATDISQKVLKIAKKGIYSHKNVSPISHRFRTKYLRKGKGDFFENVRFAPELRSAISFRKLNFLQTDYGFQKPRDVILCRNVMIYFNSDVRERVLRRLCQSLREGGYLILGSSILIKTERFQIRRVAPGIYQKSI